MTNTDMFFGDARAYQAKRAEIVSEFENALKDLENKKGSAFYSEKLKEAEMRRNSALYELRSEYAERFNHELEAMAKANGRRGMMAPTDEELRILQLVKMKDHPTEPELEAAAKSLRGNPACLSVLTDIARKNGYIRGYMSYAESKEMPVDAAEAIINGMYGYTRDFMEHDTTRAARLAREQHGAVYGSGGVRELPKRKPFETKEECFELLARVSGDELTAFCMAVDA